ncbi:MAG: hypothetical protein AB7U23_10045 [Dehalococcoidia bacterium]
MPDPILLSALTPAQRAGLASQILSGFAETAREQWATALTDALLDLRPAAMVGVMVTYGPGGRREHRIISAGMASSPDVSSGDRLKLSESVLAGALQSLLYGSESPREEARRPIWPEGT